MCSRFLYLPRRSPLSRASLSHRALTSLSWAARAAFCLARMFRLLSRSPTMRRRSEFSQAILFLVEAKSPRVRLASSTFLLMAFRVSNIFLLDMSAEAWALISGSAGISDLIHDEHLVLLNLGLHLAQGVNLLSHLSSGVSLLPLQVGEDGLLLDVGLLNVLAQLVHFRLALLVELNLGGGGAASLVQTLTKLVDFPGKVGPLPLS